MLEFAGQWTGNAMRIEFSHSARDDFQWTKAQLRIGSAADNDLVLASAQAAPSHLRIEMDRRGWVLHVLPAAARVYVNARPVRERALLRPGDTLGVGDCRMLLREDASPEQRVLPASPAAAGRTAALRAVAGNLSGRVLPIAAGLELGPHGRHALELPRGEHAGFRVDWQQGRLMLGTVAASPSCPLRVNGVPVQCAPLQPGDQLSLGPHRWVLDAPGMQAEPEPAAATAPIAPASATGVRGEVWWLMLTAAALALAIALALWLRF